MMCDPTLAGTKDPVRRREKLSERIKILEEEILMKTDQIGIMEHEIKEMTR